MKSRQLNKNWAIKCYFIAQFFAENRAEKTLVGRQAVYNTEINTEVN
jgi:hypothetical protein